MTKPSVIVKLKLEDRCLEMKRLRMTEQEIANVLTSESNHKITVDMVHNFLHSTTKILHEALSQDRALKETIIKSEMDTIEERKYLIARVHRLGLLAEEQGDIKTAIAALNPHVQVLESLDKTLGKYKDANLQVNIAMQQNNDKKFDEFIQAIMAKDDQDLKDKITDILKEMVQ